MYRLKSTFKPLFVAVLIFSYSLLHAGDSVEETRAQAELFLIKEVAWFQQGVIHGSQTDIRLRQASLPLIEAVGIWDNEGHLIFPDQESAPHIYDVAITHNLSRLQTLRRAAQPNAWEAFDFEVDSLLFCSNSLSSVCLLINTEELAKGLKIPKAQLVDALFQPSESSAFSLSYLLIVMAGLLLFPFAYMKYFKTSKAQQNTKACSHIFVMGDMEVDPKRMTITREGVSTAIGSRDLKLLICLYEHPGEVISKDRLYNAGWGRDFIPNSRSLEQHIMTLRKKIDPDRNRRSLIETVHGQGYRYPLSQL